VEWLKILYIPLLKWIFYISPCNSCGFLFVFVYVFVFVFVLQKCRYLWNQESYHRTAGVKMTWNFFSKINLHLHDLYLFLYLYLYLYLYLLCISGSVLCGEQINIKMKIYETAELLGKSANDNNEHIPRKPMHKRPIFEGALSRTFTILSGLVENL